MDLITDDTGLMRDGEGAPRVRFVDSFVIAVGAGPQSDVVILRLLKKPAGADAAWRQGEVLPPSRVQQFALHAHRAEELAQALLQYAAQARAAGESQH